MQLAEKAKIFAALSDPLRLRMIDVLASAEQACGKELAERLDVSVALVSHHAKLLEDAGLIIRKKEGQYSRFSINRQTLRRIREQCPLNAEADAEG
jgi:DNA-binding transcriptional ArsR family regulator